MDKVNKLTKDIAKPNGTELIHTHFEWGKIRLEEYIHCLESEENLTFYEPIKKNKMDFFRQVPTPVDGKHKVLKDCRLFSKLFISCQSRESNLQEFQHKNQPFPVALSDSGKLHTCQKSWLVAILEGCLTLPESEPMTDAIIIDGSALVNSLCPRTSNTFEEYAS